MARPRKCDDERRSATVRADVTLAEKCYVQEQSALAGLREAEYVRRRVLDYAVPPRSEKLAVAALVSEINRLGMQVSMLGNVVNQVARAVNSDRSFPDRWEELPCEIKALRRLVQQTLETVILHHGG